MFDKFKNIHEIIEDLKGLGEDGEDFYPIPHSYTVDGCDGIIRQNYGLREIGRRLTVFDEVGGIFTTYKGYAPINGGNVVYMEM